jgi:hypothetical protein
MSTRFVEAARFSATARAAVTRYSASCSVHRHAARPRCESPAVRRNRPRVGDIRLTTACSNLDPWTPSSDNAVSFSGGTACVARTSIRANVSASAAKDDVGPTRVPNAILDENLIPIEQPHRLTRFVAGIASTRAPLRNPEHRAEPRRVAQSPCNRKLGVDVQQCFRLRRSALNA